LYAHDGLIQELQQGIEWLVEKKDMERNSCQMGNYQLKRLLRSGAFADVYEGSHRYLDTRVAIKVLRVYDDTFALDRFLTEARHLSRLVHPHIIRILEFGMEGNIPYLVMDYAAGGSLRQCHPPGTIVPLPTIVSYVESIASALQYAHNQHFIHRDMKPENLLLGATHEVLLSDFGLALLSSGGEMTQAQERFGGTFNYMAPEQMSGHACPASDQYALAVITYEWLSGQRPFSGMATADLVNEHVFAPAIALRERHPELSPAVEQVIFKALAKDPTLRYADVFGFATAFAEACQDALQHVPLHGLSDGRNDVEAVPNESPMISSPQHLPVPLTPLLGRTEDLLTVQTRLLRTEVRLLTLIGTPGVGKTRLALALATQPQVQAAFPQGVYFVSLTAIRDPEQVLLTLIRALGLPVHEEHPTVEQVTLCLQDQHMLLVLDTFEHIIAATPLLVQLLIACPWLKLVVTSRAVLHVSGEYEFVVPPLALPDLNMLPACDSLAQMPVVALFVARIEAVKPGFTLTERNMALIARLCVQLEGIPLAIELAAMRCKFLSLQALSSLLAQDIDVLVGCDRNQKIPLEQRSLDHMIGWSYDLLLPDEQAILRRLCIFDGAFTLEAAAIVVMGTGKLSITMLDGCASLVDQSLLQLDELGTEPYLQLCKMIRMYGMKKLVETGELEQCRDAYMAYAKKTLKSPSEQEHNHFDGAVQSQVCDLPEKLTARECEVLHLLAMGLSNNQIAQHLVLSPFTVNRHVQSIYGKLGVNSRSAATRFAMEYHLF
jgi:predicted ATPase/serine/threonine protein kinase/DNA-binding CsgD family transcriptional regulator